MEENIYYMPKENESVHSVMPSLDYDFAVSKYKKDDFRFAFIERLKSLAMDKYKTEIYNCKLQTPGGSPDLVNVYFYMWEDDDTVDYRIENKRHYLIELFNEVNKQKPLIGFSQNIKWQFFVVNIKRVMRSKAVSDAVEKIKVKINKGRYITNWDDIIYWFVDDTRENIDKFNYLDIRQQCYKIVKKYDKHGVLDYDSFHLKVDEYNIYSSIGGYNYFKSDYMFSCRLV